MQVITRDQLTNYLLNRRGCTAATITAATDARLLKTGNPHGTVTKIARVNGMIGWSYGNSVNNQRAREGQVKLDFQPLPRKWGDRIKGTPLVEYKGNFYLEFKVQKVLDIRYVRDRDGQVLTYAEFAPWVPVRNQSKRQKTQKEVRVTDYGMDKLLTIKVDGYLMAVRQAA